MSGPDSGETVPPQLAARMNELLLTHGDGRRTPSALVDAAVGALGELIARPEAEQSALDLLAVDGLATAAFEAVTDATELEAVAEQATKRLLALGDTNA